MQSVVSVFCRSNRLKWTKPFTGLSAFLGPLSEKHSSSFAVESWSEAHGLHCSVRDWFNLEPSQFTQFISGQIPSKWALAQPCLCRTPVPGCVKSSRSVVKFLLNMVLLWVFTLIAHCPACGPCCTVCSPWQGSALCLMGPGFQSLWELDSELYVDFHTVPRLEEVVATDWVETRFGLRQGKLGQVFCKFLDRNCFCRRSNTIFF